MAKNNRNQNPIFLKTILLIFFLTLFFGILSYLYIEHKTPKVAFIEVGTVYEAFEMKKELELLLEAEINKRSLELDGLKNNIISLEKSDSLVFKKRSTIWLAKMQRFEEFKETKAEEINGQIFKRMNQYTDQYGRENNYSLIFGANGNGSLVFADSTNNISKEIIEFINFKYKNGN